jgi:Ca-activated chloride channel homolog
MKINTLFASKNDGGKVKGGLVLMKLRKTSSDPDDTLKLKVVYEDRNGHRDGSGETISIERESPEYFDNDGIRKGVLLARYATLLQNWLIDERAHMQYSKSWNPCINRDTGILVPAAARLTQWEKQSLALKVSGTYKDIFTDFSRYFNDETDTIGDTTLNQEASILSLLARHR